MASARPRWTAADLTFTQLRGLSVLARKQPRRMSDLAEALEMTPASASALIDRMDQRGFVTRRSDPEDRRTVLVELSRRGQHILDVMERGSSDHFAKLIEKMTPGEREALATTLRAFLRIGAEMGEGKEPQMLISLLRRYVPKYRVEVAIVTVLVFIQSIANLYLPNLNADIINNGVAKGDTEYIWRTGAVMLAVTLVLGVLAIISVYFASRASMGVGRDVRGAVFERVQHFSAREMTRFGTPSLITRNTNDVQQVQLFMQIALTILLTAPILAIGGVIMAIRENAQLSLTLVVIVPLMAVVIGTLVAISLPLFRQMQGRVDKITEVLREQIMGIRVVRAFIRTAPNSGASTKRTASSRIPRYGSTGSSLSRCRAC
jgi:DNA-binding MarR family transcriptional regulator